MQHEDMWVRRMASQAASPPPARSRPEGTGCAMQTIWSVFEQYPTKMSFEMGEDEAARPPQPGSVLKVEIATFRTLPSDGMWPTGNRVLMGMVRVSRSLSRLRFLMPRIDLRHLLVCFLDRLLGLPALDEDPLDHMAEHVGSKHLA